MSHRATNWAFQQRGLSPAQRVVLLHLADRHNPDFGCFPSQAQLAADCEISRASLNVILGQLEASGLIRRERRVDPATRRQRSTRYILGFECDDPPEPCPVSGHGSGPEPCPESGQSRVQNLDTNPVREPVSTTARDARAAHAPAREAPPPRRIEAPAAPPPEPAAASRTDPAAALTEAGGSAGEEGERDWLDPCLAAAQPEAVCEDGLERSAEVLADWRARGFDLQADVLPVIRERTGPRRSAGRIRSWAYFTEAVADRHRRRQREADRPAGATNPGDAPSGDPLTMLAAWINTSDCVPPSAVTNTQRDAMLARGLVTADRLRALGIR